MPPRGKPVRSRDVVIAHPAGSLIASTAAPTPPAPPSQGAATQPKPKAKVAKAGHSPMTATAPAEEEDMYQEPFKLIVRPESQLQLTEAEMKDEHTRALTADDPNVPANISKYNYKERCYKVDPPDPLDNLAIHFSLDGSALHIESTEAKDQEAYEVGGGDDGASLVASRLSRDDSRRLATTRGAGVDRNDAPGAAGLALEIACVCVRRIARLRGPDRAPGGLDRRPGVVRIVGVGVSGRAVLPRRRLR